MTDYASFKLGGLASPLPSALTNSSLQDSDPALYWLTQFCQGVIQTHVGARWNAEVNAVGLSALAGHIVQATIPYDPVPIFQEAQFALPLLALYRVDSDFSDRTVTWIHRTATWGLDYILPALTPAQMERLLPLLNAIEAAIYDRINQDYDPAVLSGQTLKSLMGSESIKLLAARPARDWLKTNTTQATGTANTVLFPLLHMRFEVAERKMPDTYAINTGVDGVVNSNNGSTNVDVADFSTNT